MVQIVVAAEAKVNNRMRSPNVKSVGEILFLLMLAMPFGVAAAEVSCPDPYTIKKKPFALEGAIVLEGQPRGRADLLPEPQDYEWNIAPNQAWVTQHGKAMYLACRYKGLRKPVNLEIPRDATACKVEETEDGIAASCKALLVVAKDRDAKEAAAAAIGKAENQH